MLVCTYEADLGSFAKKPEPELSEVERLREQLTLEKEQSEMLREEIRKLRELLTREDTGEDIVL